jgi:hypothetical protein
MSGRVLERRILMAKSHSKTLEKWMAHVGSESALMGSERTLSSTPASGFSPRLPMP